MLETVIKPKDGDPYRDPFAWNFVERHQLVNAPKITRYRINSTISKTAKFGIDAQIFAQAPEAFALPMAPKDLLIQEADRLLDISAGALRKGIRTVCCAYDPATNVYWFWKRSGRVARSLS